MRYKTGYVFMLESQKLALTLHRCSSFEHKISRLSLWTFSEIITKFISNLSKNKVFLKNCKSYFKSDPDPIIRANLCPNWLLDNVQRYKFLLLRQQCHNNNKSLDIVLSYLICQFLDDPILPINLDETWGERQVLWQRSAQDNAQKPLCQVDLTG